VDSLSEKAFSNNELGIPRSNGQAIWIQRAGEHPICGYEKRLYSTSLPTFRISDSWVDVLDFGAAELCPSAPPETLSGAVSHRLLHLLCRIAVRVLGGGSELLMRSWFWDADVHGGYKFLVTLDVERRNIEFGPKKIQAIGCVPTQKVQYSRSTSWC
jgi:hypothetical protein